MAVISGDIFPLQNLSVLIKIGGSDMAKRNEWANQWITKGFDGGLHQMR